MKRILRIGLTWLLLLAMVPACGVAAAEATQDVDASAGLTLTYQRSYEVTSGATGVYLEGSFTNLMGTLPAGMMVRVLRLSNGNTTVTLNGVTGYIAQNATRKLQPGDRMVTNRITRVYQRPNTSSRFITVRQGLDVSYVGSAGNIVQVERNGITGYMYIYHLDVLVDDHAV